MSDKVLILKREDFSYDIDSLHTLLERGFDLIWGKEKSLAKKILIKPNLLMEAETSSAITTHPNLIIALAKLLRRRGFSVFVADNPGGFGTNNSLRSIYRSLGLDKYPDLFTLLYNDRPPFKEGEFTFSWWAKGFEIVNLPKLKTHDLLGITAGVKNLYGLIPGVIKSKLHQKYPYPYEFAEIILKIYDLFTPKINILDGIVSLEGEGPARKGIPRKRGLIIFSNSGLALDYTLAQLIGILPENLPHLKIALEREMIKEDLIEVYPQDWPKFKIRDFMPSSPSLIESIPKPLLKVLGKFLKFYPVIERRECKRCQLCLKVCPAKAIEVIREGLRINLNNCIGCMCCAEVCLYGAVRVKDSFLLKTIKKVYNLFSQKRDN